MNILTDILSLFKRKKFVDTANDDDVLVLGISEQPEIEGIASPVPYKDVKLIKVVDLIQSQDCEHVNVPTAGIEAGVFRDETTDPITGQCYVNLRRLKSLSLNLTIVENGDYIDFDNLAEANTMSNVGTGAEVYKEKIGEEFILRTIISSDGSILITQETDEIDIKVPTILMRSDFGSIGSRWINDVAVPNTYGIGYTSGGFAGQDEGFKFDGPVNYSWVQVTLGVVETRQLPGLAEFCPVDVLATDTLTYSAIMQSDVSGITVNVALYRLIPGDLGNSGASGTTLTILHTFSVDLDVAQTSGGVTTYTKQHEESIDSGVINEGDYLFIGYNYTGTLGVSELIQVNSVLKK